MALEMVNSGISTVEIFCIYVHAWHVFACSNLNANSTKLNNDYRIYYFGKLFLKE